MKHTALPVLGSVWWQSVVLHKCCVLPCRHTPHVAVLLDCRDGGAGDQSMIEMQNC